VTDISFGRYSGEQLREILDAVIGLYLEIQSERAGEHYDMFSRASFIERTSSQAQKVGFELIAATSRNSLIGFSFGYSLPAGQWWADCTPPPQDVLVNSKFAVIELNVRKPCRGHGVGKRLLDILISGRSEKYATLAARPDSPAHANYIRWGWYTVGIFETPPVMDAMVRILPSGLMRQ
jgi:ribosomal protein S18 acetylase RimI-like enzyme